MAALEKIDIALPKNRTLYALNAEQIFDILAIEHFPEGEYALYLYCEKASFDAEKIKKAAKYLVQRKLAVIYNAGPKASDLEDLVDEVFCTKAMKENLDYVIMSSSQDYEGIPEQVSYFLNETEPDENFCTEVKNSIIVVIGNANYYNEFLEQVKAAANK